MKTKVISILISLITFAEYAAAQAVQRFPKPEFEYGHQQPPTLTPAPRAQFFEFLDVAILI
ncbi:MAG: hypothetical protein HOA61_02895, partial [Bacteroidetes bacterium]|nr:hypothetical protein [Bacteroidota bacterium]